MKAADGRSASCPVNSVSVNEMNLAVASPAEPRYSETFIRMQMEELPCKLRIYGRPIGNETVPGGRFEPMGSLPAMLRAGYCYGVARTGTEGYQSWEIERRLRKSRTQVLLANYGPTACALLPVCRSLGIPLVAHFHGYDAHVEAEVNRLRDEYVGLGQHAAAVVAVSERMVRALIEIGIPGNRIHLTRYGVDANRFREKVKFPSDPIFFGVGRFVDKKAPYLTLLAFDEVLRQHPRARLVLGGDGALMETTRNLCAALGLTDAVEFPGVLKPDDVAAWMQRATAYVQHSISPVHGPARGDCEGTPVAILEALVSGLPVVSTRHAGIEEVVEDGVTGFLVCERDVAGMARAMSALAASPELARRLGAAGRLRAAEQYTAARYVDSLKRILESVV